VELVEEKMGKKKSVGIAAFVIAGIVVLGLAAAVYAKYVSSFAATGSASVAKWAFVSDNSNNSGTIACELSQTYDADTLVAGKIAPGTSGKCPIVVSNEHTEVGVHYEITLPSGATNKPTNLKFYTDDTYTTEVSSAVLASGNLAPGDTATTTYVYWMWPYEDDPSTANYDTADTTDGTAAVTMSMAFTITGTQVQP